MKKFYTYIIMACACMMTAMLSSCELETSGAGDFDGMWHLTRVDTLATGGVLDLSKEKIFWSFQFNLMEADDKDHGHQSILMRYNKSDGKLLLTQPYAYDRENGDAPLAEPTLLKPFGINNIEETFQIQKLSGGKMQLQSEMLKLYFKKF